MVRRKPWEQEQEHGTFGQVRRQEQELEQQQLQASQKDFGT
jgi:hypothetical protein